MKAEHLYELMEDGFHVHLQADQVLDSILAALLLEAVYQRELLSAQRKEVGMTRERAVGEVLKDLAQMLDVVATIPRTGVPLPGVPVPAPGPMPVKSS